jgi:hypothetical protein
MRSRTKVIAAALVTAALAAGSAGAAVASTTGTKPGAPSSTMSAGKKPAAGSDVPAAAGGSKGAGAKAAAKSAAQPGTDAFTAAVAAQLHLSTARAGTALRPLLAAGMIESSSPEFAAVASSLGVTPQQLLAALAQAKQSLAGGR